jgi:hypothetical protein
MLVVPSQGLVRRIVECSGLIDVHTRLAMQETRF